MLGKLSESLTFINLDGEQCIMKKGEVAVGKVTKSMYPDKGVIEREDGSVLIKRAIEGQVKKEMEGLREGYLKLLKNQHLRMPRTFVLTVSAEVAAIKVYPMIIR